MMTFLTNAFKIVLAFQVADSLPSHVFTCELGAAFLRITGVSDFALGWKTPHAVVDCCDGHTVNTGTCVQISLL